MGEKKTVWVLSEITDVIEEAYENRPDMKDFARTVYGLMVAAEAKRYPITELLFKATECMFELYDIKHKGEERMINFSGKTFDGNPNKMNEREVNA